MWLRCKLYDWDCYWHGAWALEMSSVDSKVVVDLIADADTRFHPHGNLIEDVRAIMRR